MSFQQLFLRLKWSAFLLNAFILFSTSLALCQSKPAEIIPPSPTAQTFTRYGEIPVDFSTGVPSIEIPIHIVKGRRLQVPISLTYHASGIKVSDIASEVGLGWALNCGGMVARSVNGIRDESKGLQRTYYTSAELFSFLNQTVYTWEQSSGNLQGIMDFEYFLDVRFSGEQDPQSDRYFYKLPDGRSGVFVYDYSVFNESESSVVTLPYRPYRIQRFVGATASGLPSLDGFQITDDNGTIFRFESYQANVTSRSEWLLHEIISADATDTIKFHYIKSGVNKSIPMESFVYSRPTNLNINCMPYSIDASFSKNISPSQVFSTPTLDRIVSSETTLRFNYSNREDFDYLKRLTEIIIETKGTTTTEIKKVHFFPKYFGATTEDKRLGLEKVVITSPDGMEAQEFAFSYESQTLPPYPYKMAIPKYSEDYWGYYNGANSSTLVPRDFIANEFDKQAFGANRDPDPTGYYSKACMLTEIKYPTGGRSEFQFERHFAKGVYPHKSNPPERDGFVGGFRVVRITAYDEKNQVAQVKSYQYSLPTAKQVNATSFSYTQDLVERKVTAGIPGSPDTWCWANYSNTLVFSNPVLPLEVAPGLPVVYQKVTEFFGTQTDNIGKTIYRYEVPYSPADFLNHPDHPLEFEAPRFYNAFHFDKGNYVPHLVSKKTYKVNAGEYHPLLEEQFNYSSLFTATFNCGIQLTRKKTYPSSSTATPAYFVVQCDGIPSQLCAAIVIELVNEYLNSIVAIDTKAYREIREVSNKKSIVFDPMDSTRYVVTSADFAYSEVNGAVKEESTSSSKGELLKTTYKYPHDFQPQDPYGTMVNKNILSSVVETNNFNNGQLVKRERTNYTNWGANIIAPSSYEVQFGQGPTDPVLTYLSYDNLGNPTGVMRKDKVEIAYVWGYRGIFPIAEVIGASYSAISNLVDLEMLYNASYYSDQQVRAELNKIRLGVSGDHPVSTFTFRPGIGMTSRTDPNELTTFFEYDNFGRLTSIKDNSGNILKTYEYHYQK